jgi:predicted amidohydrolase YtcJ
VVNGTDTPVERISPIACFHASITRRLPNGVTFFPEQCMSRDEALRSYTRDAAYAAFEEDIKGTLTPGKLADVVVLSNDILAIPESEIPRTDVCYTIVGGEVRYESPQP